MIDKTKSRLGKAGPWFPLIISPVITLVLSGMNVEKTNRELRGHMEPERSIPD